MLPPTLKKLLQALGINTIRLEWKLRYWRESMRWSRTPLARWAKILSYEHKYCKCGAIVDKNAKVCPHCGEAVRSRLAYRIGRALGFITPEFGFVWVGLLVAIAAVFLVELRLDGLRGLLNPSSRTLLRMGALYSPAVAEGQYWRFLSAGLVHAGLIHIAFNVIALSQLAPSLEEECGPWQFVVLLTATQLGCTVTSLAYHAFRYGVAFSVGASGIAFGLIGFGLGYTHRPGAGSHPLRDLYRKWAIYGLLFGLFSGRLVPIDNAGHIGGLLVGMALGFLRPTDEILNAKFLPLWRLLAGLCLLGWAYALLAMVRSVLATGGV